MKKKHRILLAVLILIGAILYLMVVSFTKTKMYYYTVEEVLRTSPGPGETIRIGGKIDRETVRYDPRRPRLQFVLRSRTGTEGLPVIFPHPLPDNFMQSEEVVATGRLQGGMFMAERLLVKCPSKYESEKKGRP